MHVEHENHLREVCFRPLSTSHHSRHRSPPNRAFMLVFGVSSFSGRHHNDDDAENRANGCEQGMFSFGNIYLLTISSLPTGYWGDTCSPHTHSEHDNEASFLPYQHRLLLPSPSFLPPPPFSLKNDHECSTLVPLYHHHSCPSKTNAYACFRGQFIFATTTIENERTRSFSRLVALYHHLPSPLYTSV